MSDYTPTTGMVRTKYARGLLSKEPEFDRWLAEHDREVAKKSWDEGFRAGAEYGEIVGASGFEWAIPKQNPHEQGK